VHDLAFVHEPAHFTAHGHRLFRRSLRRIAERATLVLCSSSATVDDCTAAGLPTDRLRVVPLGTDPAPPRHDDEVAEVRRRHGLEAPYLLFQGTLEPRKNLPRLLEAFARLVAQGDPSVPSDLRLALVGQIGWGEAAQPPASVAERVVACGFVPARDLHALFAGALVCCQPSIREGFGLPVLQAMAHGTPVVTSRGTSTEEVAGGAAVLVDPTDVDDIAAGIVAALRDPGPLAAAGRHRAAELTWARTAERTVAAYREAIAMGPR
jgi:glycosyltransferase involved in cell wall biosynthesis